MLLMGFKDMESRYDKCMIAADDYFQVEFQVWISLIIICYLCVFAYISPDADYTCQHV